MEAHRVVIRRDSHIVYTTGSQMAVRLLPYAPTALYSQEDSWYSFLFGGWVNPRAIVRLKGLGQLQEKSYSLSGIEPATFRLVA
jgi:hypothetical protein